LAIAPSAAEVRKSYATIFPSHLGIRLARRVNAKELEGVLSKVKESEEMEDGRRLAKTVPFRLIVCQETPLLKCGWLSRRRWASSAPYQGRCRRQNRCQNKSDGISLAL
jgi:hypothetical protein